MPMNARVLALAVSAAFSGGALCQAPPAGTYNFTSGPGVGTANFTVSGFSTSLGGSIGNIHVPNCSGLHVHGVFNGFADPNPGGCGHGIISLVVNSPSVSGGSLPGGAPTNVAGQLALFMGQSVGPVVRVDQDLFLAASRSGFSSGELISRVRMLDDGRLVALQRFEMDAKPPAATGTPGGAPPPTGGTMLRTALADPAQRILSSPSAVFFLEDFAAYDDRAAAGYRRDADKTREQANAWRELAEAARRDAERNRQRAEDARKDGRDADAKNWDEEAKRDEDRAGERDAEGRRLDGWSEEAERREAAARDQAQERRDAAERAREAVRQAERDRVERIRAAAEEKARIAQEARNARLQREQIERDARAQAAEDRVRARAAADAARAQQRAQAERDYRRQLDAEARARDARARGGSTLDDAMASAARTAAERKKKEEEEKTWADYVIGAFNGDENTRTERLLKIVADKAREKVQEKLDIEGRAKDYVLEKTGINKLKEQLTAELTEKIGDLGLDRAAGKLGSGWDDLQKVKKLGEWMESELQKQPAARRQIENRMDVLLSARPQVEFSRRTVAEANRGRVGDLYGKEMFGVVARGVEANR